MSSSVGSIVTPILALGPAAETNAPRADQEREKKLSPQVLISDPRWKDLSFRADHFQLDSFLREFNGFMNGESSPETLQNKLKSLLNSTAYKNPENKKLYDDFFRTIRAQLGSLKNPSNQAQAQQVLGLQALPDPAAAPPSTPRPEVTDASNTDGAGEDDGAENGSEQDDPKKFGSNIKDRYFSVGASLQLNRLATLALRGLGFNPNGFVRQQDTTVKIGATFSVGQGDKQQVLSTDITAGGGKMTSIPGDGLGDTGTEYHAGAGISLVNPHPKKRKFEASGIKVEVIGVSDHAGKDEGVPTPRPVARLGFTRQSPWAFNLGRNKNFQLQLGTVPQDQEVNFALNNPPLEAVDEEQNPVDSPFAVASNLFPTAKLNLVTAGFRWWPHGAPQHITREDLVECDEDGQCKPKKFKPGEGLPKVLHVLNGGLINFYRRTQIYPAYANNRIYLGTFEPLGASSRDQYNLLGLGLTATTALDGHMMASNVRERSEVWARGTWLERGAMIAVDGVHAITDIALAATAKKDPPEGQTLQQFIDNPGMVRDFLRRGAKIDLSLFAIEEGMTVLDRVGAFGRITDEKKGHYIGVRGGMMFLGLLGFFVTAPATGAECGPSGTSLQRCGFGTTGHKDGQFFDGEPDHTSPDHIKQVQRQSIVSSFFASLISYGATGLLDLSRIPKGNPSTTHQTRPEDIARKKRVEVSGNASVGPNSAQLGVRVRF